MNSLPEINQKIIEKLVAKTTIHGMDFMHFLQQAVNE